MKLESNKPTTPSAGKPGGPGGFTTFASVQDGLRAQIHLLSTKYRAEIDARDWNALVNKYAPPSENDSKLYAKQMYAWTERWQKTLGIDANWVNQG